MDKQQRQQSEPSHRQTCQYPPKPEVVVSILDQQLVQPLLVHHLVIGIRDVHLHSHEHQELLERPDHALSNFFASAKDLGLFVGECTAVIVEARLVVVGEHPLDVVVGTLHPLPIGSILLLNLIQPELVVGNASSLAVECHVGELLQVFILFS